MLNKTDPSFHLISFRALIEKIDRRGTREWRTCNGKAARTNASELLISPSPRPINFLRDSGARSNKGVTGLKFFLGFHRAVDPKQNEATDPECNSRSLLVCDPDPHPKSRLDRPRSRTPRDSVSWSNTWAVGISKRKWQMLKNYIYHVCKYWLNIWTGLKFGRLFQIIFLIRFLDKDWS